MIPYELALIAWLPISIVLMADRDNARGFSIAVVGCMLLLPEGRGLEITGLPDVMKHSVCAGGCLAGTVLFHPNAFLRFRFRWYDSFVVVMLGCLVVTSVKNGLGPYDGLSAALGQILDMYILIGLARMHLSSPRRLKTFLLVMVWGSVLYTPLALWEFRMSPGLHTMVYGYFQHVFVQMARGGFWRPIVFFPHALNLGRFFALCAFLAAFPLRESLGAWHPIGRFVFVAPLVGLALSMSWSPYLLFILLCGSWLLVKKMTWPLYVLPVLAFLWLGMVLSGAQPMYGVCRQLEKVSPSRAGSLEYRLDAWEEYRANIVMEPIFGHGRFGKGRIHGRATDSTALVVALSQGMLGAGLFLGWWACVMNTGLRLGHGLRGTQFAPVALGGATALPICLAFSMVDSALDFHVWILTSGLVGVDSMLRAGKLVAMPVGRVSSRAGRRRGGALFGSTAAGRG